MAQNELAEEEMEDLENPFWNRCKEHVVDTLFTRRGFCKLSR
jgi:hypothetical protein